VVIDPAGIGALLTGLAGLLTAVGGIVAVKKGKQDEKSGQQPPSGGAKPATDMPEGRARRRRLMWAACATSLVTLTLCGFLAFVHWTDSPPPSQAPERDYAVTDVDPPGPDLPVEVSLRATLTPASLPAGWTSWLLVRGPGEETSAVPCDLHGSRVRCEVFRATGPRAVYRLTLALANREATALLRKAPRLVTELSGTEPVWSGDYVARQVAKASMN
jgi:hypothetical protein